MQAAHASACTDITGFGLFGHLLRLARQGKLTALVFADALPAFPGVLDALRNHVIPGAVERNREYVGEDLRVGRGVEESSVHLGCDPQTSGGLLIAVSPEHLPALQKELHDRGVPSFVIGRFAEGLPAQIHLSSSAADSSEAVLGGQLKQASPSETTNESNTMNPSNPPSAAHGAGCCADIFSGQDQASSAPDTQKAFGALMQSVQAAGKLDAKTKELILFSLVVQSRCAPCFDAHLAKARELGITQAELDEAAWCAIAMGGAPVRMFYVEAMKAAPRTAGVPPA
jgi:AhpD family alkylhydroperoxidase